MKKYIPNKTCLLILFVLFAATNVFAQARFTFSGTVKDANSGETIIGAIVRVENNSTLGAATNEYGFFSLTVPAGEYIFVITSLGYTEKKVSLVLDGNKKLTISLLKAGQNLSEVKVTAKAKNDNVSRAQMGVEHINLQDVKALPVLFGERDILKTIQLLPGVKNAGEGNSGYFVRGGAVDQNLILLDEAIVYNPAHLLGFFSTFNSDAIKDVTLYKGNMPAQYGGRLSSVMDVKMNEGNDKQYGASGSLGLISSKLNIEGPIVKEKGSFLVSGRRTYADVFLKLSSDTTQRKSQLYFYDINAKANYKLGDKDRLFVSFYNGKDKLGLADLFGLIWGNTTATARWNHELSPKLFSNTSLIYSNYTYNISINTFGLDASIFSQIRDWNLKEELSFFPNPKNSIKIGLSSIYHRMIPGEFRGNVTVPSKPYSYSWENAIYANNSYKASSKLNIEYGIRLSTFTNIAGDEAYYTLDDNYKVIDSMRYTKGAFVKTFVNPEPRLSASYMIDDKSSVKAAYSRNAQYLHLIANSSASNPTDKWIASNSTIKPGVADQLSAGYFRNFSDNKYEFSVEGYYKYMQNQIDYRDGANVFTNDAIEPELRFGIGRAYGVELLLRKKVGRFTGWIGYTLSRTEKKIDHVNEEKWYVARQDRTHDLSVVGMYKLNEKWTLSGVFVYYTGNAVSFPSGKYQVDGQTIFYYKQRNEYRMPAYHRLDLSATRQLTNRKRWQTELAIGLYNVYGRQNAYVITFRDDPNDKSKTQAVQTSLFRWVPSISYNFKF